MISMIEKTYTNEVQQVLSSIRKYGQYKLFDSPWNKMIMIGNETDLHYKVVDLMKKYYADSILVAGLDDH